MQCLVLAGGLATRMRPLTEKIPKALIEVEGLPFVHYQLDWLSKNGITDAVFCIGYRGDMIRDYVGDGKAWSIHVSYVDEGKDLQGTGGAIRLSYDAGLLDERFFVVYGDSYLPIHFREVWKFSLDRPEPALMTVLNNGEKWDQSNVCFSKGQITLYDKRIQPKPKDMVYIDYGLSILKRVVVETELIQGQKADLADLFTKLSKSGQLAGFEVQERFYEIGSLSGLADFKDFIMKHGLTQPRN